MDHVAANTGPAKAQGIVGVEQSAGIELVAQAIAQHGFIVFLPLVRDRRGHRALPWAGCAFGQALHKPYRTHKQVAFGLALTSCSGIGRSLSLRQGVCLSQLLLDVLEVL
jgi:hypothetical protein